MYAQRSSGLTPCHVLRQNSWHGSRQGMQIHQADDRLEGDVSELHMFGVILGMFLCFSERWAAHAVCV